MNKNRYFSLLFSAVMLISLFIQLVGLPFASVPRASATIHDDAVAYCASIGDTAGAAQTACINGYQKEKQNEAQGGLTKAGVCNGHPNVQDCNNGWDGAAQGATPGSPASQLTGDEKNICFIYNSNKDDLASCKAGVDGAAKNQGQDTSCSSAKNKDVCKNSWAAEKNKIDPAKASQAAQDACKGKTGSEQTACIVGFTSGNSGDQNDTACASFADTGKEKAKTACQDGFKKGQAAFNSQTAPPDNKQLTCDVQFTNPLTWLVCPVIDILAGIVSALDNMITDQMNVPTNQIFCQTGDTNADICNAYYKAWQTFRNIALGLVVIVGLVILIAQALGTEILDAYTIRKTLPRVLFAAIAITLSWPFMKFFVMLSNDLGFGIRHLIYAPFSGLKNQIDLTFGNNISNLIFGSAIVGAGTVGGAGILLFKLSGGIGALLGYVGTAALAVFIAIMVLIIRQIAIILLMLLSPLAIIAFVLPNTKRIYDFWWDSFAKALMMFPLIAAFIATGRVFAAVAFHNAQASGVSTATQSLDNLIGFFAYFAPYFLIPLTFQFAGGAIRQIGGFVNDRSKGGFDRLRNFRQSRREKGRKAVMSGNLFKNAPAGSYRQRLSRGYQAAGLGLAHTDEMGGNPLKWRQRAAALRGGADFKEAQDILQSDEFKPVLGDDDFGKAVLNAGGTTEGFRRYLRSTGKFTDDEINQKASHYELLRSQHGDIGLEAAALMSSLQASTFLTPGDQGRGELLDYITRISRGDNQTMAQLIGQAKEIAPRAGRQDVVAPFSEMYTQARFVNNAENPQERQARIQAAGQRLGDIANYTEGPEYWVTGKGAATEGGMEPMQRAIQRAYNNLLEARRTGGPISVERVDGTRVTLDEGQAEQEFIDVLAQTSGTADLLGRVSPEKQRLVRENVLNQSITSGGRTIQDEIDDISNDPRFIATLSRYEREIRGRYERQPGEVNEVNNPNRGVGPPAGGVPSL